MDDTLLDYDDTDLEDFENDFEFDESDDSDERVRRRRIRPRTPSGQGLYRSRPTNNAVTQAQLQTALNRVGQQIKAGSTATQQLAGRVNVLVDRLDKEIASRKKADAVHKKAASSSSMNMMLPLLLMQGGAEISDKEGEKRTKLGIVDRTTPAAPKVTHVIEVISDDERPLNQQTTAQAVTQNTKFKSSSTDMTLPLVLMMGMGGMSGGGGSDNNMMMMLVLVMMMQKK